MQRWSVNDSCARLACGKPPTAINLPCAHATYCAEHAEEALLQRVTSVSTAQLAQCGTTACYECPQCGNLAFAHTKVQSSMQPCASLMKAEREITTVLSKKAAHFEQWTSMTFKHLLDLKSERL